ncbi:hypothetical protein [Nocardia farcinica]|uniref:hypothetical protein n=1 Tax=Nocardia farcinica TaxID=37329 RepID=UPI0018936988|nr:hypothetical protein [Nocardia farcinica]MBF6295563.1 hypothetical protein [Nocardia farcinica]MBF6411440.1 hypothetical protein [Nocardia farcinica]
MAASETAGVVRVFQLHRDRDVTGYSGTGVVADGVIWPDGAVSMRWRGPVRSTVEAACLADIQTIHGHDGATRVVLGAVITGGAAWTAA